MVHDQSWEPIYFGGQKVKGQGHESQVTSLHSCECWLLLVWSFGLLVWSHGHRNYSSIKSALQGAEAYAACISGYAGHEVTHFQGSTHNLTNLTSTAPYFRLQLIDPHNSTSQHAGHGSKSSRGHHGLSESSTNHLHIAVISISFAGLNVRAEYRLSHIAFH